MVICGISLKLYCAASWQALAQFLRINSLSKWQHILELSIY
jgi:hypothetical protein